MRRSGAGALTARVMYAGLGPQFGYSQNGALD